MATKKVKEEVFQGREKSTKNSFLNRIINTEVKIITSNSLLIFLFLVFVFNGIFAFDLLFQFINIVIIHHHDILHYPLT